MRERERERERDKEREREKFKQVCGVSRYGLWVEREVCVCMKIPKLMVVCGVV